MDVAVYLVNHKIGSLEDKAKLLLGACQWGDMDVVKTLVEQHNVKRGNIL